MLTPLLILAVMTGVGILFGLLLAFANKKFHVETNPLIHEVDEILPKGQCGACGFAGCMAYAEAVVLNKDVSPNLCVPGKEPVAKLVAQLTGKTPEAILPKIAYVRCAGTYEKAAHNAEYQGVKDCVAANIVQGGGKTCKYGCLGFGNCVTVCVFDAIKMGEGGLPVVDPVKCTGCGQCALQCPRTIIELLPHESKVWVHCSSIDKGAVSRQYCSVSCIGCRICEKACPYLAIKVENNLAKADYNICITQCSDPVCFGKCPTQAIRGITRKG